MRKDRYRPADGYASAPESNPEKYALQVGQEQYPMKRWREAIIFFLFHISSGKYGKKNPPTILFGYDLALGFIPTENRFCVVGAGIDKSSSTYVGSYSHQVHEGRLEVVDALMRFVKDDKLGQIEIKFEGDKVLSLFKKERSNEYGCSLYVPPLKNK